MAEYKIQLPVFEGPLDLLLYLIKKEEVDIYEVNLTRIATQFVEYLEQMKRLDLDVAGEFVVMAATLIWIKSKELLPVDQRPLTDLDEENNVDLTEISDADKQLAMSSYLTYHYVERNYSSETL